MAGRLRCGWCASESDLKPLVGEPGIIPPAAGSPQGELGVAWQGLAWLGEARQGSARPGMAGHGKAWPGKARIILYGPRRVCLSDSKRVQFVREDWALRQSKKATAGIASRLL
jgi:hypothetical protein